MSSSSIRSLCITPLFVVFLARLSAAMSQGPAPALHDPDDLIVASDPQTRRSDQLKIREVAEKCEKARGEVREAERENRKYQNEFTDIKNRIEKSGGQERKSLQTQANSVEQEGCAILLELIRLMDVRHHFEVRLKNLRKVERLRSEIELLESQRKEKEARLRLTETQWSVERSKLLNAECFLRLSRGEIESTKELEKKAIAGGVYEENGPYFAKMLEMAAQSVQDSKAKADGRRAGAKRFWDEAARIRDEILDIDVILRCSRVDLNYLEKTRREWDRDPLPDPLIHGKGIHLGMIATDGSKAHRLLVEAT